MCYKTNKNFVSGKDESCKASSQEQELESKYESNFFVRQPLLLTQQVCHYSDVKEQNKDNNEEKKETPV